MKLNLLKLNLPANYNIILIKNKNVFNIKIYDEKMFFKIILKSNIKINKNSNCIEYKEKYLKKKNFLLNNYFFNYFEKINKFYFIKIKFKGKGYKVGFYKKKINFFFW